MRRTWIGMVCAVGVSLAAVFVGQAVRGQPEMPRVPSLPLPSGVPLPPISSQAEPPPSMRLPEGPQVHSSAPVVVPPGPGAPQTFVIPAAPPTAPVATAGGSSQVIYSGAVAAPVPPRPEKEAVADTTAPREGRASRQEPAVSIEWVGPPTVRLNHPLGCQLIIHNHSTVGVQNVIVRHKPAEGTQFRSSEPQAAQESGELAWALGALAAGQSKKIDLQLVAQARGPLNCQASVTFTAATAYQVVVREPLLAVKMRAPDKVVAGEPLTLHFTVSNPGDGATDGVKLKAHLPEGLEHSRGRLLEVDVGSLAPKETKQMQLVCLAKGSGAQKCQVMALAEGGLNSADTAEVEILVARLDLAMSGPKLRYLDRHAVYLLKVTNPGSAPATSVAVHEAIPAGFKFHSASAGGRYDEATRTVAWALGDLPPSQTREVALDLVASEAGEHRMAALASSARGLKSGAEMRTHVEGVASLAIELVDADDPVEVGAETAYELRITNTCTKPETNLEVSCTLPEQVELRGVKSAADLRYRVEGRELVFEPVAKLAAKADVIYRIQVRGKLPGDARLRVRVRADGLREPVLREESTRFYTDDTLPR